MQAKGIAEYHIQPRSISVSIDFSRAIGAKSSIAALMIDLSETG
jgi:hypothetical protein